MTAVLAEWQAPRIRRLPSGADPQRFDDPEAWGTLARPGLHNPLRDHHYPSTGAWFDHHWDKALEAAPDEVRRFHARYQQHLAQSHPAIQVPTAVLKHIMSSGRVKSQFETGTSVGWYTPQHRTIAEKMQFGYPKDHPDEARPVYGYLTKHPYTDDSTESYGAHSLILHKPRVWHRTTFSGGDSLDNRTRLAPVPVHAYQMHAVPLDHFGVDSDHADGLTHEELGARLRNSDPEDLADMFWNRGDREHRFNYPEAQYHGGVTLKDVRHVILRSHQRSGMDDEAAHHAAHLTRAGVPWVHTNGWQRPGPDAPSFHPRREGR